MRDYPDIYVLRHGQTHWNAEGRFQGQRDSALTLLGREQAADQGKILEQAGIAPGTAVISSPQGRAWSTAEVALAAIGRAPVRDDRLKEVGFGDWEGLTIAEIRARWPISGARGFLWHFTAPGGESFDDMRARVQAFLDDLTGPAVIVTHGITSRVLRGIWLGLDPDGMAAIESDQGVVYCLSNGAQIRVSTQDMSGLARTARIG